MCKRARIHIQRYTHPTRTTSLHTSLLIRYIGKVFFDKGSKKTKKKEAFNPGEFRVTDIAPGNNFRCERLCGEGAQYEDFDMTYTIKRIREYEEE